jgi:hypothetical protein
MGNAPLGHEICGHMLNLDLTARATVLDQEGQRTLKLAQDASEVRKTMMRVLRCMQMRRATESTVI